MPGWRHRPQAWPEQLCRHQFCLILESKRFRQHKWCQVKNWLSSDLCWSSIALEFISPVPNHTLQLSHYTNHSYVLHYHAYICVCFMTTYHTQDDITNYTLFTRKWFLFGRPCLFCLLCHCLYEFLFCLHHHLSVFEYLRQNTCASIRFVLLTVYSFIYAFIGKTNFLLCCL